MAETHADAADPAPDRARSPLHAGSSCRSRLAQFICSFAGSNMNVMINDISEDLNTTVKGVQTAITLFLLIMAILMIPCSKLTDRWGRKRCFMGGLALYGVGALVSAIAPNLGILILGNSVLEGVGTALLIPPVYILADPLVQRHHLARMGVRRDQRARRIGAAAGPLIGGVITTGISWRAALIFQAAVVGTDHAPEPPMVDPLPADPMRPSDASERSVRRGSLLTCSASSRPARQQAHDRLPRRRRALLAGFFLFDPLSPSEEGRSRSSRRSSSITGCATWRSSRRTSSGCSSWASRSSYP